MRKFVRRKKPCKYKAAVNQVAIHADAFELIAAIHNCRVVLGRDAFYKEVN